MNRRIKTWKERMQDGSWVGALLTGVMGVFVIVTTVWAYFSTEVTELTVTILAETPLVNVASEAGGFADLTVFYRGEPASNVVLLQVKVENTGNIPIQPDDFITPFRYVFADNATVVDSGVLEVVPENLGMTIESIGNVATTPALLLNAGDRAVTRFLVVYGVSESEAKVFVPEPSDHLPFKIDTRIIGIKEVNVVRALDINQTPMLEIVSRYRVSIFGGLLVLMLVFIFTIRR